MFKLPFDKGKAPQNSLVVKHHISQRLLSRHLHYSSLSTGSSGSNSRSSFQTFNALHRLTINSTACHTNKIDPPFDNMHAAKPSNPALSDETKVRLQARQFLRLDNDNSKSKVEFKYIQHLTQNDISLAEILEPSPGWRELKLPGEERYPDRWTITPNSLSQTVKAWRKKAYSLTSGHKLLGDGEDREDAEAENAPENESEEYSAHPGAAPAASNLQKAPGLVDKAQVESALPRMTQATRSRSLGEPSTSLRKADKTQDNRERTAAKETRRVTFVDSCEDVKHLRAKVQALENEKRGLRDVIDTLKKQRPSVDALHTQLQDSKSESHRLITQAQALRTDLDGMTRKWRSAELEVLHERAENERKTAQLRNALESLALSEDAGAETKEKKKKKGILTVRNIERLRQDLRLKMSK